MPLDFTRIDVRSNAQIRHVIEAYAAKTGQTLSYQQDRVPMRFTLNGIPYAVNRIEAGRAGLSVSARRVFEDDS